MIDLAVFLGRFQPFHNGHLAVVKQALSQSQNLMIGIGSANEPRTIRNPFTSAERELMIRQCLTGEENRRVVCVPIEDSSYNITDWLQRVQVSVDQVADTLVKKGKPSISLIGHSKDHSSYYLKLFPQWESINVENYLGISATDIRESYFQEDDDDKIEKYLENASAYLPPSVVRFLLDFTTTESYCDLVEEQMFIDGYKKQWTAAPYAPTFVTTDAVVICGGHVLLVKRKARPGKGLWAIPGGFLEQHETVIDGIIRELREETGIKIPVPVLKGSMVGEPRVFDSPYRSLRGRTITHAGLFLINDVTLPKVRGQDDAEKARWVPIKSIKRDMMFEDHWAIIETMLKRI